MDSAEKYSDQQLHDKLLDLRGRFKEQDDTAQEVVRLLRAGKRHIIVEAEEKSGKRDIKKLTALSDRIEKLDERNNISPYHIYVVALNRVDIKPQLTEFWQCGIDAVIIRNKTDSLYLAERLQEQALKTPIVVHLDEADYATGNDQVLRPLKPLFFGEDATFSVVGYSATPQEPLFGDVCSLSHVVFKPHKTYRGAAWFLDNNMVRKPKPFLEKDETGNLCLSEQGREIVELLRTHPQKKNVAVVRLTGKHGHFDAFRKIYEACDQPARTWGFIADFVDCRNPKQWSRGAGWDKALIIDHPQVIFINQTCSRSTEVHKEALDKKVLVWHDCRYLRDVADDGDTKRSRPAYNTLSQAFGRFKHYHETGLEIYPYIDEEVWLFQTGRKDWFQERIKLGQRVVSRETHSLTGGDDVVEREVFFFDSYDDLFNFMINRDWDTVVADPCADRSVKGYFISGPNARTPKTIASINKVLLANHIKPPIGGKDMRPGVDYFRTFVGYERDTFKTPLTEVQNKHRVILFRCRNRSSEVLQWSKDVKVEYTAHRSVFADAGDLEQISDEAGRKHVVEADFQKKEALLIQEETFDLCRKFVKEKMTKGPGIHWDDLSYRFKKHVGKACKTFPKKLLLSALSEAGGDYTQYLTLPNVLGTQAGIRNLSMLE